MSMALVDRPSMAETSKDAYKMPHASILQELLLALLGYTGDVFIRDATPPQAPANSAIAEPGNCDLHLAADLEWISPADRESMTDLVTLGFHFAELEAFVGACRMQAQGSLLWRALASGLTELLDVYRAAVLRMQQQLRGAPVVSLASLRFSMQEFKVLLPALHRMVHQVQREGLRGAALLRLLAGKARCGTPELASCAGRLAWHCHQILLAQVSAWTVHGVLLDEQGEFFVGRVPDAEDVGDKQRASPLSEEQRHAAEWHRGFQVVEDALPPGVSMATAQSVLFIGKAVRVLQRPSVAGGKRGPAQLQMSKWAATLRALAAAPFFQRLDFERAMQAMHVEVAGWLWSLVLGRAQLLRHLAALKDYCLLSRGDFWQAFLLEARPMMQLPPRLATANADLADACQLAATASSAESDAFLGNVRIRFAVPSASGSDTVPTEVRIGQTRAALHVPALDQWDALYIDYKLDWLLHIILTPEVMAKYNSLFQHLLRLKRVSMELDRAWGCLRRRSLTGSGSSGSAKRQHARRALWLLRHQAAHHIANLLIYMQVDVVEAQAAELADRMGAVRDFKDAEAAHTAFLDACCAQCFLDMRALAAALEGTYALCLRVCALIQRDEEAAQAGERLPGLDAQAAHLAADFGARTAMLYTLLQSGQLQATQRAPYLRQLLLRLNFNGHVEREAIALATADGSNEDKAAEAEQGQAAE